MAGRVIGFFARRIGDPYLVSAILSLVPATELKGSILYAAACGGKVWFAALVAYATSLLLALLHTWLLPLLIGGLRRHPRCERIWRLLTDRISASAEEILCRVKSKERRSEQLFFGVYAFVAIPLPLTGVWAGAILATMLGLDRKSTFLALALGNFTAGGIVLAIALLSGAYASAVLDIFCVLILIFLLIPLIKKAKRHRRLAQSRNAARAK